MSEMIGCFAKLFVGLSMAGGDFVELALAFGLGIQLCQQRIAQHGIRRGMLKRIDQATALHLGKRFAMIVAFVFFV